MEVKSQHVVRGDDGWVVRKGGNDRATKRFTTQEEAVSWARDLARSQRGELYIHSRDGKIREKYSYTLSGKMHDKG